MKLLGTGAAAFIDFHTSQLLLGRGDEVVRLDGLNDYYDVSLKKARLALLQRPPSFRFVKMDLADRGGIANVLAREKCPRMIHLGAQAGVRYSLKKPLT